MIETDENVLEYWRRAFDYAGQLRAALIEFPKLVKREQQLSGLSEAEWIQARQVSKTHNLERHNVGVRLPLLSSLLTLFSRLVWVVKVVTSPPMSSWTRLLSVSSCSRGSRVLVRSVGTTGALTSPTPPLRLPGAFSTCRRRSVGLILLLPRVVLVRPVVLVLPLLLASRCRRSKVLGCGI